MSRKFALVFLHVKIDVPGFSFKRIEEETKALAKKKVMLKDDGQKPQMLKGGDKKLMFDAKE
jgi:hypothetical protein